MQASSKDMEADLAKQKALVIICAIAGVLVAIGLGARGNNVLLGVPCGIMSAIGLLYIQFKQKERKALLGEKA